VGDTVPQFQTHAVNVLAMVEYAHVKQLILKFQLVLKLAIVFKCQVVAKLVPVAAQQVIYM
jgi:hypothetical protein